MAKVTKPAATSKPATKPADDKKPEQKKPRRVFHPALKPVDGKPTAKLDDVPSDWDPAVHKPLRKGQFAEEHVFLRWRAGRLRDEADRIEKRADMIEKLGSTEDRKKASRIVRMQSKMEELKKQLAEQGIDVESILNSDD